MKRTLRPSQLQAESYLKAHNGSGALFMTMRLGKTVVVIRHLHARFGRKIKALVLAPVEGLWTWRRELRLEGLEPTILSGAAAQRRSLAAGSAPGWYVLNYEGLRVVKDIIQLRHWDAIVLDESRKVANPKTQTTKSIFSLPLEEAKSRIVMCGEPAPEGPLEYFNQLRFVFGEFMGCQNYWQFRNRYMYELAPGEWLFKKGALDRFKEKLHEAAFFLDWKKAGLKEEKVYETRTLQPPPELLKLNRQIIADFEFTKRIGDWAMTEQTKWVPVQYMWLHQLGSGFLGDKLVWPGRINSLLDLLTGELSNEQVVVWFHFNQAIHYIIPLLEEAGISYGTLVGADPRTQREANIDRFRSGKSRVLLCQIKCGRTSIDLSNSSTAIYFTNTHSLDDRIQTEYRILNPSKRGPNLIVDFASEGCVDEDIVENLQSKKLDARFFKTQFISRLRGVK